MMKRPVSQLFPKVNLYVYISLLPSLLPKKKIVFRFLPNSVSLLAFLQHRAIRNQPTCTVASAHLLCYPCFERRRRPLSPWPASTPPSRPSKLRVVPSCPTPPSCPASASPRRHLRPCLGTDLEGARPRRARPVSLEQRGGEFRLSWESGGGTEVVLRGRQPPLSASRICRVSRLACLSSAPPRK